MRSLNNPSITQRTARGLEGFLKDWEKAREKPGDVFEPASARSPKH